jgi:hypothetical protein
MTDLNLRVFQKDTHCPKCGEADIAVRWCPGYLSNSRSAFGTTICKEVLERKMLDLHKDRNDPLVKLIRDEHMERVCRTCTYAWIELPLDKGPALHQLAAQAEAEDDH